MAAQATPIPMPLNTFYINIHNTLQVIIHVLPGSSSVVGELPPRLLKGVTITL